MTIFPTRYRFFVFILLAIFSCRTGFAAPEQIATFTFTDAKEYYFVGTMNEKLPFSLQIKLENDQINGVYRYSTSQSDLNLTGKIGNDGSFELSESYDDRTKENRPTIVSGSFQGLFDQDLKTATGTWKSPDGKKSLAFSLTRKAVFKIIRSNLNTSITYPHFEDPQLAKFNEQVKTLFQKKFQEDHREFKAQIDEYAEMDEGTSRKDLYALDTTCTIRLLSNSYVSLLMYVYSNFGGAHPNHNYFSYNFEIASNGSVKDLKLSDLMKSDKPYAQTISAALMTALKKQGASLVTTGETKEFTQKTLASNTFTIEPTGLRFQFAPYEVGCYAEGSFEVLIPFKALKDVVNSEFLKALGQK